MHPYATDSTERVRVLAALVVASIVLGNLTGELLNAPLWWLEWIVDLSAVGWFAGLFAFVDRYLWRFPPLRKLGIFHIPNLNGTWRGELRGIRGEAVTEKQGELRIEQTWSHLVGHFSTDQSHSHSEAASVLLDQNGQTVLRYEYHNTPFELERGPLDIHWGTTRLVLVNELGQRQLRGAYYTNRKEQTRGELSLVQSSF